MAAVIPVGRLTATNWRSCLLYTSDAADERSSVDLGGRRIIKKKKQEASRHRHIGTKTYTMRTSHEHKSMKAEVSKSREQ